MNLCYKSSFNSVLERRATLRSAKRVAEEQRLQPAKRLKRSVTIDWRVDNRPKKTSEFAAVKPASGVQPTQLLGQGNGGSPDVVKKLGAANNILAKEVAAANSMQRETHEKYVDILERYAVCRIDNEKLSIAVKKKDEEIIALKLKIQEMHESQFCTDLIQFGDQAAAMEGETGETASASSGQTV